MSLVYELLTIVCGFVLPKFILEAYGSSVNGLVSSIAHFLGFISLCELGMGAVVPASLYKPLAERDNIAVSKVIVSAQRFYRLIAYIMLAYVAGLVVLYPIIVKDSFDFVFTASLIVIISVSTFAQYYFGITYTLLLKSDQKQYISYVINSVTLVLNTVFAIILIKVGCSIHIVKIVSSVIFISRPLFLNIYVKKHYVLDLKVILETEPIKQKWNGVAQHLASTIQEKADTIVLTLFSSLVNVSIYGVYFMVINGMKGLVYSLTGGMSSFVGHQLAQGDIGKLQKMFEKFEWSMHTISTALFTITGLLVVPFVQIYTSKLPDTALYTAPVFSTIMCAALAMRCIQMPYNVVVHASGHFRETQKSAIIEPIINVVISVLVVCQFGLVGVAVGTFFSMSYRVFYLAHYLMKHIIYIPVKRFFLQLAVDSFSVIVICIQVKLFDFKVADMYDWIKVAIIISCVVVLNVVVINFIFYSKRMISTIKSIIH